MDDAIAMIIEARRKKTYFFNYKIPDIVRAMEKYRGNEKLQYEATRALLEFAGDTDACRKRIAKEGGIAAILRAMESHKTSEGVQEQGCACFYNLAINAENRNRIANEGGIASDEMSAQGTSLCLPRFSLRADKLAENILLRQQDLPLDSSQLPERAVMRDLLEMLENTKKETTHGEDGEDDVLNFHNSDHQANTLNFDSTQSLRHRRGHRVRNSGSSEAPECANDDGCLRRRLRPALAQLSQTLNTIVDAFIGTIPLPDSLESQREHFSGLFRRLLGNEEDVRPSGIVHTGDDGVRSRRRTKEKVD
eukprot:g2984.t1